jgi:hypothetical protein
MLILTILTKVHLYDVQSMTYHIYSDRSIRDLQFVTHMS